MEIVLEVIVALLAWAIIFLAFRCHTWKKHCMFYLNVVSKIVTAETSLEEAVAILSAMYHIPDDEVVRRLTDEPKVNSNKR